MVSFCPFFGLVQLQINGFLSSEHEGRCLYFFSSLICSTHRVKKEESPIALSFLELLFSLLAKVPARRCYHDFILGVANSGPWDQFFRGASDLIRTLGFVIALGAQSCWFRPSPTAQQWWILHVNVCGAQGKDQGVQKKVWSLWRNGYGGRLSAGLPSQPRRFWVQFPTNYCSELQKGKSFAWSSLSRPPASWPSCSVTCLGSRDKKTLVTELTITAFLKELHWRALGRDKSYKAHLLSPMGSHIMPPLGCLSATPPVLGKSQAPGSGELWPLPGQWWPAESRMNFELSTWAVHP